ncbi:Tafazzin [Penicillium pulvis]|uniref:Tafazzin family protein n=1 Tax=Penicillium frequentans TaxID=3151616 RepID=A0AAD6CP41_9EURO|nr:Tafazzin [Penicillium pulvis]KAJ5526245.1 Tafazzin [Penicillium glabrum]KAJ5784410.1 Tafazzin [Penicillium pulvis]
MDSGATGDAPSLPWRAMSNMTMWGVAGLCRAFLSGLCNADAHGAEAFTELLDSRRDPSQRTKGLITVSNHISVMDDPLLWGILPPRFWNKRWSFGSHDICFQTRPLSFFFTMGQVLPTHRLLHSPFGGLGQPAVTEAIRLLSKGPFPVDHHRATPERQHYSLQNVCVDPFSDLSVAYTTNGEDAHLAPSAYSCNSYSWVHIFPEGKIHQAPRKTMRYFKWGVARLILEAKECPDVVPMWIEGFDNIMHESREFPRFLPRPGKKVDVTFGPKVDSEAVFGDMRSRWQKLKTKVEASDAQSRDLPVGVLSDALLHNKEAVELRKEVTRKIRNLVLDVRRSRGLPDEDPKEGLVETWLEEGPKREGHMKDDSWIRDI